MKKKKTSPKTSSTEFDLNHKEQAPEIPKQVIQAPKEATDPAEALKHA